MDLIDQDTRTALVQLVDLWGLEGFSLIGATALFIGLNDQARTTKDIDLVLNCDLEDYPAGLNSLAGWRPDHRSPHRWYSPSGVAVDVLPGSASVARIGLLTWPGGQQMNVAGLDRALVHVIRVAIDDSTIQVTRVPMVVFLKMEAFMDRPAERERDLGDIARALHLYEAHDVVRITSEPVLSLAHDTDETSACMLGLDLGVILDAKLWPIVARFLETVSKQDGWPLSVMARKAPSPWGAQPATVLRVLAAFERAIEAARDGTVEA